MVRPWVSQLISRLRTYCYLKKCFGSPAGSASAHRKHFITVNERGRHRHIAEDLSITLSPHREEGRTPIRSIFYYPSCTVVCLLW